MNEKYLVSNEPHPVAMMGGMQRKYQFPNGYGASVIQGEFSYGGDEGLFELAVFGPDGHLTYDTPITDDVLGYLTEEDVVKTLALIEALPKAST